MTALGPFEVRSDPTIGGAVGVGDRFPVLSATAADGRVRALTGYLGAAGD